MQPHAALAQLHTALTLPSRRPHASARHCSLSPCPPPPPPLLCLTQRPHAAATDPHAAARRTRAAVCSPHAVVAPPSRRCTPLLTVFRPSPPHSPSSPATSPCKTSPHHHNAAVAPPSRSCTQHSRRTRAALAPLQRPHATPTPHVSRPVLSLPTIWGGGGGRGPGWARVGMEWRVWRGRAGLGWRTGRGWVGRVGWAAGRVGPGGWRDERGRVGGRVGRVGRGAWGGVGWYGPVGRNVCTFVQPERVSVCAE